MCSGDLLVPLTSRARHYGQHEGSKYWLNPKSGPFDTLEDFRGIVVVSEPDEVVEQILELAERPIDHLVFDLPGQFDRYLESLELFAERVIPAVQAELDQAQGLRLR